MIPLITKNDLIIALTQIKSSIPAIAPLNLQNPQNEFKPGEKYPAVVEKILPNNTTQLLVADKQLQVQLPSILQPGTKLTLMVTSIEPQLEFAITNEISSETPNESTSLSTIGRFLGSLMQDLSKNQNPTQTQTATNQAPTNTNTHFKSVELPNLLQKTINQNEFFNESHQARNQNPSQVQVVTNQTPIAASTHLNSAELPGLLQKAINQSGLFYESHQAKWINGETTLENLRQEPQGKILVMLPDSSTLKAQASAQLPVSDMPVHSQSLPLVTQQLLTLETGQLFWRGEVWKNQFMDWDIYEEKQENKEGESVYVAPWHSQIRLTLPNLGEVLIKISLIAQDVSIKIGASESETLRLLKNNQPPLAKDMYAAGLNIQSIEIHRHDANA